jgi:hypothetical protein
MGKQGRAERRAHVDNSRSHRSKRKVRWDRAFVTKEALCRASPGMRVRTAAVRSSLASGEVARRGRPSESKLALGRACCTPAWRAMRQYPRSDPAATAAWKWDTPSRRSRAYRVGPFFHCRRLSMRDRRRIQASGSRSTIGAWQKPK